MALIEVENLAVKYPGRKRPILEQVNLQLHEGETVLLLGASGSGKSTLALTLNGLIPHNVGKILEGRVRVDGLDTQKASVVDLARRVGIVFQDPDAQFVMLTVEDEIVFGMENLCLSPEEMDRRVEEALAQVGLPQHRYRRVEQLSGGEKQRVTLASLLAMEPSVLLFDEPTANLDPVGTRDVFALLRQCKEMKKHTILLIEHKLDDLMDLIDRVVVLGKGGVVLADGAPRTVFQEQMELLQKHGVWVPQVASLAHRLAQEGIVLDPFPLTLDEAEEAINRKRIGAEPVEQQSVSPVLTQESEQAAIEVRNLSYRVASREILHDVSLRVPQGDFLALVGSNGAGKTTLAHHLVDILHPPAGRVWLQGKDITRIPARELVHHVGYVFQNPEHQFITESVADEIAYGLRVMGLSAAEITERTNTLLERFGLLQLARANPFTLSHGEKRRLSVATMLAVGQQVLILDEPTFGQDQRNAEALLEILWQLHTEGRTIVVITHDMALVAQYARHVVVMESGRPIFHGTPATLFAQPDLLARAHLTLPPLTSLAARLGWPGLLTSEAVYQQCMQALGRELAVKHVE